MRDVVVIGAGIQGVGVAQAAAAAGYDVVVVEQVEPAYGTSSRSTKLIHGGLRYLESAQFSLVRETLRERALLLRLAPELVYLNDFYIPVYEHSSRRPWQLRLGLAMYAALGGFGVGTGFGTLPKRRWDTLDGLQTRGLQAVWRYQDAQTDDRLLTLAVWRSAQSLGAELRCPETVTGIRQQGQDWQVELRSGDAIDTRCVVNAAGPWAAEVLGMVTPAVSPIAVELVQGSHLLLQGDAIAHAFYVESPRDRRAVFVLPWGGRTMVGTTEHVYHGAPEAVAPRPDEIAYLRETCQHYFPARDTHLASAFAGLRVLPRGGGVNRRSREAMFHHSAARLGLISLFGGKLTAYRAAAERVCDLLRQRLGARRVRGDTRRLELTAGPGL